MISSQIVLQKFPRGHSLSSIRIITVSFICSNQLDFFWLCSWIWQFEMRLHKIDLKVVEFLDLTNMQNMFEEK